MVNWIFSSNQVFEHIKSYFGSIMRFLGFWSKEASSLLVNQMTLLFITAFWQILNLIELVIRMFLRIFDFFQREIFIFFINLLERTFEKYKSSTDHNSILSKKVRTASFDSSPNLSTLIAFLVKKVSEYNSELLSMLKRQT